MHKCHLLGWLINMILLFQSNFEAGNVELSQEEVKTIDNKLDSMEFKVFGGH